MSRYNDDKMHWFAQLMMNVIISLAVAGCALGVANGMFHKEWGANAFWASFFICLAACYGIWYVFIRDSDGSSSDIDGPDLSDIF